MKQTPNRQALSGYLSDEPAVTDSQALVLPGTGEVVSLENEVECVRALAAIREFEARIKEAKATLSAAIAERARTLGTKTLVLPNGDKAELRGGREVVYDALAVEEGLRALGMPEDRLREIVTEEVTYKVNGGLAKRAAAVNEDYKAVIEGASHVVERPHYIAITKRRA